MEFLSKIALKYGYRIIAQGIPRKRVNINSDNAKLDTTPRVKEWENHPDKYIFTDIIVYSKDVFFYLKDSKFKFNSIKDLFKKRIGTHLGYKYPLLEKYFKKGLIIRDDARTEELMLKKLFMKREEAAAIINELVGFWIIKMNNWKGSFLTSKKNIGKVGYRIMFTKKWKSFVKIFNRELFIMKKTGKLEKIIEKYK